MYSICYIGTSGSPPALNSCKNTQHIDYDSVKDHQKVSSGPLIFTYGVEWKSSDVR